MCGCNGSGKSTLGRGLAEAHFVLAAAKGKVAEHVRRIVNWIRDNGIEFVESHNQIRRVDSE